MSILNILKESLLNEKLPLSAARKYVKQGRENAEELPEEYTEAYAKMFGGKNRIHIGDVKISNTEQQFIEVDKMLQELIDTIYENQDPNKPHTKETPSILGLISFGKQVSRENPQAISIAFTPKDIELKTKAEKYLSQAKLPNGGYLLKTVIKRLKSVIDPQAYPQIQQMTGHLLTRSSDIRMVDSAPVILSKHPYDVAGMSQSKRWKSCKKAIGDKSGPQGCNASFLDAEVGHILIAFIANPTLTKGKDMLSDPYARLLVLPVKSDDEYGLHVSSDVYDSNDHSGIDSPMNRQLYNIVTQYVSEFMPVFDENDDKEMVGDYYKDSKFGRGGMTDEELDELRFEAFDQAMNRATNRRYIPRELSDAIYDHVREDFYDNMYNFEPDNIAGGVADFVNNRISPTTMNDIDTLFEHMDELGIDTDDYVHMYIDNDVGSFLEMMDSYNPSDVLRDHIQHNYHFIDNYNQLEYMNDNGLIANGVLDFINDDVIAEDSTALETEKGLADAFVGYVIRHENDEKWSNAEWKDSTDIEAMWNNMGDNDFEEFYGFLRLSGFTHEEIMSVFEELEDLDSDTEAYWDKELAKGKEE